jgi:ribosomal RNA small subunit methyltransferase B
MSDARYLAVKLLVKTFRNESYSNLQLNGGLVGSDLNERDKRLCSAIYYGVIERKITLDHIIGSLSSRPLNKLDDAVLNILRSGIYQILYMDSVPDNAAVSESVELAKKFAKTSASGMVNAILRNFLRQGKLIMIPKDIVQAMTIKYSAPVELVEGLISDYGPELAENLLAGALEKNPVAIRRNNLRCSDEELISLLEKDYARVEKSSLIEGCFLLEGGDIPAMEAFKRGFFHVQDISSQLCCHALNPTENDVVLDICAAPGGKTFTMAELMNGSGEIHAFDLHEKRVQLIRDGAQRLGIENIRALRGDAAVFDPELPEFTKILCDVPCSGFGVIGKKPEIKYKSLADFKNLPEVQYKIADNAVKYLSCGGEMIYSTCTLRKAENDEVCDRLLANHPEIEPVEFSGVLGEKFGSRASIFPCHFGSDGFFIAKFRKKE